MIDCLCGGDCIQALKATRLVCKLGGEVCTKFSAAAPLQTAIALSNPCGIVVSGL